MEQVEVRYLVLAVLEHFFDWFRAFELHEFKVIRSLSLVMRISGLFGSSARRAARL